MPVLVWDEIGKRFYETGVDRGVLYLPNAQGDYVNGVAWNGLVSVTQSPTGAEPSPMYADNIKYLNLYSREEFGATLEAFTYPDEFNQFDGLNTPTPGVMIGQQRRKSFGLAYRSRVGNDIDGDDLGYKIHLVYGCFASPSEKGYQTINESPEIITFSWELSTTPVAVAGLKPTALVTIDSRKVLATTLAQLERQLYGDAGVNPVLPKPDAVISMFAGGVTVVTPVVPTYNATTKVITIPVVTGVTYFIDGLPVSGNVTITKSTIVQARPNTGFVFTAGVDDDWFFQF